MKNQDKEKFLKTELTIEKKIPYFQVENKKSMKLKPEKQQKSMQERAGPLKRSIKLNFWQNCWGKTEDINQEMSEMK